MYTSSPVIKSTIFVIVCTVVIAWMLSTCAPSPEESDANIEGSSYSAPLELESDIAAEPAESPSISYSIAPAGIEDYSQLIRTDSSYISALVPSLDSVDLPAVDVGEELWIIATPGQSATRSLDTEDSDPGSGALLATVIDITDYETKEKMPPVDVPLPLKHTAVSAKLAGYIGTVDVTQQFENPFDEKIEAVYMFPLPEKAAISEFVMTIGERRIRGILRERAEAEAIYREARAQGYQASLLTQHRPNVFEQKVANIEPGKQIDVNIRYFHTLTYRDGWYSFVFPTVVGPRYNPPGSADPILSLPRSQVQPVSNGTGVRYLRPEERSGHDISITVELDAGVAIEAIEASHYVNETRPTANTARIELVHQAMIPNQDFVLDFQVAGKRVKSNILTFVNQEKSQGYFTMMLYPPNNFDNLRRHPMEMVFVVDASGSMSGEPITQAKAAVLQALDLLTPQDTFQIIRFSTNASQFGETPVSATPENISIAKSYVRQLSGDGGTEMIEGIRAALDFPHDSRRLRFVTFLTDGYVGNEVEILSAVHRSLGDSRIFSFGVGSSVNRFLLERMASVGRGAVAYLGPGDSGGEVMRFFFDRISNPVLTDLDIDWGGMQVTDVYPARMPDLFIGRTIVVTGKFQGEPGEVVVNGRAGGHAIKLVVPHDVGGNSHSFIPKVWARLRIADLAVQQALAGDPYNELGDVIKDTALEYGLVSDYTAFLAVDASERTAGTHGTRVYQAVPVPDGVRYETTVDETRRVVEIEEE